MKFTQIKLANIVGISASYLGHIERGSKKCSLEVLIAISKVLSLSLDRIISSVPKNISYEEKEIIDDIMGVLYEYFYRQ